VEETVLNLRNALKTIHKYGWFITAVVVVAIGISLLANFFISPIYEAETNLRIKQSKSLANSLLADMPVGNSNNIKQLMSTYAEILKSRTVVQEVIDKTKFEKGEPTYEQLLSCITTQPVKDTEILKVKVQATSPEEAQLIANMLVDTFNGRMISLVRSEEKVVREFIGERLKESQRELEKSENALQQYKQNQKIVAPEEETKAMVGMLSEMNKLSAENTVAIFSAQAKLGSAKQQLTEEKPGFIADSPLIQQYKSKLAELEVQLVALSQDYTNKHPQIVANRAAIEEVKNRLSNEAAKVIQAEAPSMNPIHQNVLLGKIQAEAELAAAVAQQGAINSIVSEKEQVLSKLPAKEKGLVRVMRDVEVDQELYVMLAKRYEEARINEVMQPTDVQVIDVATPPDKPIKPKKILNVIFATILGFFIGAVAAFLKEYVNKTIRTAEDVKSYLNIPVIASIPDFTSEDKVQNTSIVTRITQWIVGRK
jgi:succinoglycan biosynthesis transport protein ExoP